MSSLLLNGGVPAAIMVSSAPLERPRSIDNIPFHQLEWIRGILHDPATSLGLVEMVFFEEPRRFYSCALIGARKCGEISSEYAAFREFMWGVETHRLAGPIPPNWRVGGKREGLYRLEIGSEIDLVTWQYDLAI